MNQNIMAVNFHGQDLFIVEHNGHPYTPMKTIVENMGLDWKTQHRKLNANPKRWGMVIMTIPTLGDMQEAVCMPLRKLFGWLSTISPNKVKPELREKIIFYQNECDDVLWEHWTRKQTTTAPQTLAPSMLRHLNKRVAWLVNNQAGTTYKSLGGAILDKFNVNRRENIPLEKYAEVCAFLDCEPDAKALEGELLERETPTYAPPEGMVLIAEDELATLRGFDMDSFASRLTSQISEYAKESVKINAEISANAAEVRANTKQARKNLSTAVAKINSVLDVLN